MTIERVDAYLEAHRSDFEEQLKALLRIPSVSAQPDRDAVLDQAERCDPALLDSEVTDALQRRQQLRQQHTSGHRVHTQLWKRIDTSQQQRDRSDNREL